MAGSGDGSGSEVETELLSELTVPAEPLAVGNDSLMVALAERYEVVARLGSGAFGEVYSAQDRVLGREVAIKRIRLAAFTEPQQLIEVEHRLVREAQVAARLRHPGIVTTHDIVSCAGSSFIVMEYVAGRTLESVLQERGRLEVDETLRLLAQVAAALDHAHAAGVVHRDVKPANVMVEPSGHVKVMDFGIAKVDSGTNKNNLTVSGAIMGTPNYMSPEQARGGLVDARSDLFSLGCVLYECLSGERPFQADSVAGILVRVVTEEPTAVDFAALGLPPGLTEVLSRAMAKNPAARFASGAEMIAAVRAAAVGAHDEADARLAGATVVTSRPAALAPTSGRWRLWAAAAVAALALGLLAWIATDPHTGSPAPAASALVAQEPRGLVDRLLRRTPRVRVILPVGTWLRLALETPVSSETATEGQAITAVTTANVRVGGLMAVPRGARVTGRVSRAVPAQRAEGRGSLTLVFESLESEGERAELATKPLTMRAPASARRGSKVLGAMSGLIDRIKGSPANTEGGAAGSVAEVSAGGREIALRERAALSVELAAPATVRRTNSDLGEAE